LELDNKQVFMSVCTDHPKVIEDDVERRRAAENQGWKEPPDFDPIVRQRLQEHIRKVRHEYNKAKKIEKTLDDICGRGQIAALEDLEADAVERISTFNSEIDWLYDGTNMRDVDGNVLYKEYGLPIGKVSLWAGERGVGKTRTAIHIAGKMNKKGKKIVIFQGEVALSEFKDWTDNVIKEPSKFWVSDQVHLEDQLNTIKALRPDVVFVDSMNMIREARTVSGIRSILMEYKRVARLTSSHIVFIGHLNKGGTVKGNNDIEYLVDIVVHMKKKDQGSAEFCLQIPNKNRYGMTGRIIWMMHMDEVVETISQHSQTDISLARAAKIKNSRKVRP